MLYFTCRVGTNYGVVDTDDGALDWITKEELLEYAKLVHIEGVDTMKPISCSIESGKCNWSKGSNIFENAKTITKVSSVDFVIVTEQGKKYKFKLVESVRGSFMHFTCNVDVPIGFSMIKSIKECSNKTLSLIKQHGGASLNF